MNFETLRIYAINYYLRYYTSTNRLIEKLKTKCDDDEILVAKVINSLDFIIVEKQVIEAKIRMYLWKNKNLSYIKQKLSSKLFKKDDYEEILKTKFNLDDSLLNIEFIRRKVIEFKNKWKSKNYIYTKLFWRKEDREMINEVLAELYGEDDELENIWIEYTKLKWKYEKNKIIQKLLRKWFSFDAIKKIVI